MDQSLDGRPTVRVRVVQWTTDPSYQVEATARHPKISGKMGLIGASKARVALRTAGGV